MKAEEAVVVTSAVYGEADVKHDLIYLKFLVDPFLIPRCLSTPWIIPSTTLGTPILIRPGVETKPINFPVAT